MVGIPDADLGQRIVAFVVGDAAPEDLISLSPGSFRCTSGRARCDWSTRCRAMRWARWSEGTDGLVGVQRLVQGDSGACAVDDLDGARRRIAPEQEVVGPESSRALTVLPSGVVTFVPAVR